MALENINMLHMCDLGTYSSNNRETGGIMIKTRQTFACAPQIGPSFESYPRAAAGIDGSPAWRSRRRRKDWLSPATG
jgi:hypothetical protein